MERLIDSWVAVKNYKNSPSVSSLLILRRPVRRKSPQLFARKMRILFVLSVLSLFYISVDSKAQYVESLNMGMQFAIPYDAANIFNRPIVGFISTFLSICLCFILFFGVITSPFGYMFGVPSRKYVLGTVGARSFGTFENSTFDFDDSFIEKIQQFDFHNSVSFLHPEELDDCNKLLVCYAHGVFKSLPPKILRFYQFFSRRLMNADDATKSAVKNGLMGTDNCDAVYSSCPFDPFKLAVRTFRKILPTWWGKRAESKSCGAWSVAS